MPKSPKRNAGHKRVKTDSGDDKKNKTKQNKTKQKKTTTKNKNKNKTKQKTNKQTKNEKQLNRTTKRLAQDTAYRQRDICYNISRFMGRGKSILDIKDFSLKVCLYYLISEILLER